MSSSESSTNKPEWVIHLGDRNYSDGDHYFTWHTTCPAEISTHKYATVRKLSSTYGHCKICNKKAPDYILFQLKLLDRIGK